MRAVLLSFGVLVSVWTGFAVESVRAAEHAVILMYHRFGEEDLPSTNIRMEQFERHLEILASDGFSVLPVPKILADIRAGVALPDKTVGITIDDGYRSVYENAFPLFKKYNFPFTFFVSTDPLDYGLSNYMSWDMLRQMASDDLVTIGAHTASHAHLIDLSDDQIRREMVLSLARYEEKLGIRPDIFAFPFGEGSNRVIEIVQEFGITAAFGQHSGVVHKGSDFFRLPRFALNENYGNEDRFKLVARTKPLLIENELPNDSIIGDTNPPHFGFNVHPAVVSPERMNCFASHEGRVSVEFLGDRAEVRMTQPMPKGRTRINCTLLGSDGRWQWLGRMYYRPG